MAVTTQTQADRWTETIEQEMLRRKRNVPYTPGLSTEMQLFLDDVPGKRLESVEELKRLWPIWVAGELPPEEAGHA